MVIYRAIARRAANRPRADWYDDDGPQMCGSTVYEPEDGAQETGILNANGVVIFRIVQRDPIGFIR